MPGVRREQFGGPGDGPPVRLRHARACRPWRGPTARHMARLARHDRSGRGSLQSFPKAVLMEVTAVPNDLPSLHGRTSDGAVITMTAAPEAPSAATKLAARASPPVTGGH